MKGTFGMKTMIACALTALGAACAAKATVDGGEGGSYTLSLDNGILYATKQGLVISIR